VALLARMVLDRWNGCVRALRTAYDDPRTESPSTQNCWSWAIKRWLIGGGWLVITVSPRVAVVRCMWAPDGKHGDLWHFEPVKPKRGLSGLWHALMHKGKPKRMKDGT